MITMWCGRVCAISLRPRRTGRWSEAANGEEALRMTNELKPDVIVMDITMPVMSGIEATMEIVKTCPGSKILIFTMHESPSLALPIRRAGAKGVLTKSKATSELTPALRAIIDG